MSVLLNIPIGLQREKEVSIMNNNLSTIAGIIGGLLVALLLLPIAIILGLLTGAGQTTTVVLNQAGEVVRRTREAAGGLAGGLAVATALMIIVRQRYPRWWFDFARELTRFGYRVGAYMVLLTDRYPSTSRRSTWRSTTPTSRTTLTGGCRWSNGCWRSRITLCSVFSQSRRSSPW